MQFKKPFSAIGPKKSEARLPKREQPAPASPASSAPAAAPTKPEVRVSEGPKEEPRRGRPANARFRVFRSHTKSWESLFAEVASFLTTLGPDRVIGVSHSEDSNEGVVTVWYWS